MVLAVYRWRDSDGNSFRAFNWAESPADCASVEIQEINLTRDGSSAVSPITQNYIKLKGRLRQAVCNKTDFSLFFPKFEFDKMQVYLYAKMDNPGELFQRPRCGA